MSSAAPNTKHTSARQVPRDKTENGLGHHYDPAEPRQDMPSSAHEHRQQKEKESHHGDHDSSRSSTRHGSTASTLTSQALTRFEQQPRNRIKPLDSRVIEYRNSSPAPSEHRRSPNEQQRRMADSMKDWSDRWERLDREEGSQPGRG